MGGLNEILHFVHEIIHVAICLGIKAYPIIDLSNENLQFLNQVQSTLYS